MDKKKLLFIVGIILIVILGIIAINISKKNKEPEVIDELNENVLKDTVIDGISITDQSVITRDGLSTFMANVTNKGSDTIHIDNLYIFFTIDGEKIEALAMSNEDINANQTVPISLVFDRDISKATAVDYKNMKD